MEAAAPEEAPALELATEEAPALEVAAEEAVSDAESAALDPAAAASSCESVELVSALDSPVLEELEVAAAELVSVEDSPALEAPEVAAEEPAASLELEPDEAEEPDDS